MMIINAMFPCAEVKALIAKRKCLSCRGYHQRASVLFRRKEIGHFGLTLLFFCFLHLILHLMLMANSGYAEEASGIPCAISWAEGPKKGDRYVVEISDDPRFGTSLLKETVAATKLIWNAPKEQVYHWRVIPEGRLKAAGAAEVSSLASGSFIAIRPYEAGAQPVKLEWTADLDAASYFVVATDSNGTSRRLVSFKPNYLLVRSATPLMVTVLTRSKSGSSRRVPEAVHRFDPGLHIVGAPEVKTEAPREMIVGNEPIPAPEPPPLLPIPEAPKPVAIDLETKTEYDDPAVPDERLSELMLLAHYGRFSISSSKRSASRTAKAQAPGAGFSMRTVPSTFFHLFAEGFGSGFKVHWEDQNGLESRDEQPLSIVDGEAGLGIDLLFRNPNRRHILALELRGAMIQTPSLAFEPPFEANFTELVQISSVLVGPGLWYRWTAQGYGIGLHGTLLNQATGRSEFQNARMTAWGGYFSVDPTKNLALKAGGLQRRVTTAKCASNDLVCQADGVVDSEIASISGYIGLGYVFY
jgi:hypothetical protein